MATAPVQDPAAQYQSLKAALCEVFGLDPACSDEEFQAAFNQFQEQAKASATEGDEGRREFRAPPPPAAKAPVAAAPTAAHEASETAEQEAAEEARKAEEAKREGYEEAKREFSTQLDEANRKTSSLEGRIGTFERQRFESEVDGLLTGFVKDKKLLPAEVSAQRDLLMQAERTKKITFSDKSQKTMFEVAVAAIRARQPHQNFDELSAAAPGEGTPARKLDLEAGRKRFANAEKKVGERSLMVDARTREIMEDKKIGYGEAMRIANKEIPKDA